MERIKKVKPMAAIWKIAKALHSEHMTNEVLYSVLREVAQVVDAESATIWFYNNKEKRLYPKYIIGPVADKLKDTSLGLGEGIAGIVVNNEESVIIRNCQNTLGLANRFDKITGYITKSMICVPIINEEKCLGCIQLINKHNEQLFDEDDLELCENIALFLGFHIQQSGSFLLNLK